MFIYLLLSHCYFWLSFANFANLVNLVLNIVDNLVHLVNLVLTIFIDLVYLVHLDMFYYPNGKKIFHRN